MAVAKTEAKDTESRWASHCHRQVDLEKKKGAGLHVVGADAAVAVVANEKIAAK